MNAVDPCRQMAWSACLNQGQCFSYYDSYDEEFHYHCICPGTHYGRFCERESACSHDKCQNGGVCYGQERAYCECPPQFSGVYCERRKCSVDMTKCGYIYDLEHTSYNSCRTKALAKYRNMTACQRTLYRKVVEMRDCACQAHDLHIYFTSHIDKPLQETANWYCLQVYGDRYTTGCSNRTQECGRLMLKVPFNWPDGSSCSPKQVQTRNAEMSCIRDIEAQKLDMRGCEMFEAIFRHAPVLERQVHLKCSNCDLSTISKECLKADFSARPQGFCRSDYVKMRNCMLRRMRRTSPCRKVIPHARDFLDLNIKGALRVWRPVCDKVAEYKRLYNSWNCTTTMERQRRSVAKTYGAKWPQFPHWYFLALDGFAAN